MTNQTILELLDTKAPFSLAEEWDNVGLLIGNADAKVNSILVALDVTGDVINTAKAIGAQLIITHHPVIFSAIKRLDGNSIPYALAAAEISVISAHTNLDKAVGGVNDTLAARLALHNVHPTEDGMCRIGTLQKPIDAPTFARQVAAELNTSVRINGDGTVRTVAVCGGSGGDFLTSIVGKADAFITGEVRHHEWIAANICGLTVIEAGHHATEVPVIGTLCRWLRDAFPTLSITAYDDAAPYHTVK